MKKFYFTIAIMLLGLNIARPQGSCPGNLINNAAFSTQLTGWTQYGATPTAFVLNIQNACLDTVLALQATNNSNVGVSQPVMFHQDSCYSLCYCVEFPGSAFNSTLTIAAITPGITVAQLLSGSFTPTQAKIIDVISATSTVFPMIQCVTPFRANGNYTDIVIVNETLGLIGSDVRIDNLCLVRDTCPIGCNYVVPGFSSAFGAGTTVNFTDLSVCNPWDVLMWNWDFGDPSSGPANTSTLQHPSHTFTSSGNYTVCLYLTSIMTNGLVCQDTLCTHINVVVTGTNEYSSMLWNAYPIPAKDFLFIEMAQDGEHFELFNEYGALVFECILQNRRVELPALSSGFYQARITGSDAVHFIKILIRE